jgi:hypothetical protein
MLYLIMAGVSYMQLDIIFIADFSEPDFIDNLYLF